MEWKEFNINWNVKVKLTELGYQHLANIHNDLAARFKTIDVKTAIDFKNMADKDGYTKIQMHSFMEDLGEETGMCKPLLFDLNILISFER